MRLFTSSQKGFIGAYLAAGVAVAALFGSMAMSNMKASQSAHRAMEVNRMNVGIVTALGSMTNDGTLTQANVFLPVLPEAQAVTMADGTTEIVGKIPAQYGMVAGANSDNVRYCAYYNGVATAPAVAENQVPPVLLNKTMTVNVSDAAAQRLPVMALIYNTRGSVKTSCEDLIKTEGDGTTAKDVFKNPDELAEVTAATGDRVMAKSMTDAIQSQARAAVNVVAATELCPWQTHKLVYRARPGGGTDFVCVPEQDPVVVGQNTGSGTGELYIGKEFVPNETDSESVISRLRFRSIVGAGGINVQTNGDNVVITGNTGATSAPGVGQPLVNGNGQIVRLIAGTGVTIAQSSDGNGLILSSTVDLSGLVSGATNANGGVGVVQGRSGNSLVFRSFVAGPGIGLSLDQATGLITINNTNGVSANGALNVGGVVAANSPAQDTTTVKSLFVGKQSDNTLVFRRLQAGTGISVTEGDADPANPSGPKTLRITSDVVAGGGITGLQNVGTGAGQVVRQGAVGGVISVRTLSAGTGVSITTQGDNVIISATGNGLPGNLACLSNQKLSLNNGVLSCVDETDPRLTTALAGLTNGSCAQGRLFIENGVFKCSLSSNNDPVTGNGTGAAVIRDINFAPSTAQTIAEIPNGTYNVTVWGTVNDNGNEANYTGVVTMTGGPTNVVTSNIVVANHPDGTAPFSVTRRVVVTNNTLALSAQNLRMQGANLLITGGSNLTSPLIVQNTGTGVALNNVSNAANTLSLRNLVAGNGISITENGGAITIANTGTGNSGGTGSGPLETVTYVLNETGGNGSAANVAGLTNVQILRAGGSAVAPAPSNTQLSVIANPTVDSSANPLRNVRNNLANNPIAGLSCPSGFELTGCSGATRTTSGDGDIDVHIAGNSCYADEIIRSEDRTSLYLTCARGGSSARPVALVEPVTNSMLIPSTTSPNTSVLTPGTIRFGNGSNASGTGIAYVNIPADAKFVSISATCSVNSGDVNGGSTVTNSSLGYALTNQVSNTTQQFGGTICSAGGNGGSTTTANGGSVVVPILTTSTILRFNYSSISPINVVFLK